MFLEFSIPCLYYVPCQNQYISFVAKETRKAKKSEQGDNQVSSQQEIRSLFPVVAIGASSGGV